MTSRESSVHLFPWPSDEAILLIEEWHPKGKQHGVEITLPLRDQDVERALPVVLERANPECDAIGHAHSAFVFQQRHHRKASFRREIASDRAPQNAGLDLA